MDLFWKVIIPFNLIFVISPSFDFRIDGFRYGLHLNRLWHRWISKLDQKQKPYCIDPEIQHRLTESNIKLWRATGTTRRLHHLLESLLEISQEKWRAVLQMTHLENGLKTKYYIGTDVPGSPLVVGILIAFGKSLMLLGVSWGMVLIPASSDSEKWPRGTILNKPWWSGERERMGLYKSWESSQGKTATRKTETSTP